MKGDIKGKDIVFSGEPNVDNINFNIMTDYFLIMHADLNLEGAQTNRTDNRTNNI